MTGIKVEIVRYVDDRQPGWVECRLIDAHDQEWIFVEKVPVVTSESLDARSRFPVAGVIACRVVERAGVPEVISIDTAQPWGVAATTGETRFEVRTGQLIEIG